MWAKLSIKDMGWDRFAETVKAMRNASYVRVGVIGAKGDEMHKGGLSNSELASIHEYGSSDGRIPQRSFIRSTFDANRDQYVEQMRTMVAAIFDGKMTVDRALSTIGARIVNDIKRRITSGDGIPPPNAPSTIKRKGSARTLIDTGRMLAAITWEVVKG